MLYSEEFEKRVLQAVKEILDGMKEFSKKSPSIRLFDEHVKLIEAKHPKIVEAAESFTYSKEDITQSCINLVDAIIQEADMETLRKISFVKKFLPEDLPTEDISGIAHSFFNGAFEIIPAEYFKGTMDYEAIRNSIITEATRIAISEDITFSAAVDTAISLVTSEGYIEETVYQQTKDLCGYLINPLIAFVQENEEDIKNEMIAFSVTKDLVKKHKQEFANTFFARKIASMVMSSISDALKGSDSNNQRDEESEEETDEDIDSDSGDNVDEVIKSIFGIYDDNLEDDLDDDSDSD